MLKALFFIALYETGILLFAINLLAVLFSIFPLFFNVLKIVFPTVFLLLSSYVNGRLTSVKHGPTSFWIWMFRVGINYNICK